MIPIKTVQRRRSPAQHRSALCPALRAGHPGSLLASKALPRHQDERQRRRLDTQPLPQPSPDHTPTMPEVKAVGQGSREPQLSATHVKRPEGGGSQGHPQQITRTGRTRCPLPPVNPDQLPHHPQENSSPTSWPPANFPLAPKVPWLHQPHTREGLIPPREHFLHPKLTSALQTHRAKHPNTFQVGWNRSP